jgi:hypothetical protein
VEQNQTDPPIYTLCVAVGNDEVKLAEVELSTSALNQLGLQPAMNCLGVQMVWAPALDAEVWPTPDLAKSICQHLGVCGTRHEHECTTNFARGRMSVVLRLWRKDNLKQAHETSACFTSRPAEYRKPIQTSARKFETVSRLHSNYQANIVLNSNCAEYINRVRIENRKWK